MQNQPKILIVEDDGLMLGSLRAKFQNEGYDVLTATNGQEGLNAFLSQSPDVMISDIVMPVMDGVLMLKEIRAKKPDDSTPIIMLTNSEDMTNMAEAIATKSVMYLMKSDVQLDDLAHMVKDKLADRQQ